MKKKQRHVGDLLPLAGLFDGGVGVLDDGTYLRALRVGHVNPLVIDDDSAQRISEVFAQIAARLAPGQSLQLYVTATPVALRELVCSEREKTEVVAHSLSQCGQPERAQALRRLAICQEQSLRTHAPGVAAMELSYYVICPYTPSVTDPRQALKKQLRMPLGSVAISQSSHEHALLESWRLCEGVQSDLQALDIAAEPLDSSALVELVASRIACESTQKIVAAVMDELENMPPIGGTICDGRVLRDLLCPVSLSLANPRAIGRASALEQTLYLATIPEYTWLGFPLALTQIALPFTYSVHIQGTDRVRERVKQRRRHRRIFGLNRGTEMRGRLLDYEAQEQEAEAAQVNAELAATAGAGIFEVATYVTVHSPDGDGDALRACADQIAREALRCSDTRIADGMFEQERLWGSTLPLGRDLAKKKQRFVSRNVGDLFPLVGCSFGSPTGVPIGYSEPGRTIERIDPFDVEHENHLMVISGRSGSGKTMFTNLLLARWLAQGASGFIIDRAGHYDFLCSLIPGSRSISIGPGKDQHCVNPWDVPDARCVEGTKVAFLVALHSLLIGQSGERTGLDSLERNLLESAIRAVYARCATTGEMPRETILQEVLFARANSEDDGQIKAALNSLAQRLYSFCGEGTYAYIADAPTSIGADSPLVVFDTRTVSEDMAGALMLLIAEFVTGQIQRRRVEHLANPGVGEWAGKSFLLIDEMWKLVRNAATGHWINDLVRRSRHLALALVAISQHLSDFSGEYGIALLRNSRIKVFLPQSPQDIEFARVALSLAEPELEQIASLRTSKRRYSTAFVINGSRGCGKISIRVGELEYWQATSDPVSDEPERQMALTQSGGDPWLALRLLTEGALR